MVRTTGMLIAVLLLFGLAPGTAGPAYPNKAIDLIAPAGAGGGWDLTARMAARALGWARQPAQWPPVRRRQAYWAAALLAAASWAFQLHRYGWV